MKLNSRSLRIFQKYSAGKTFWNLALASCLVVIMAISLNSGTSNLGCDQCHLGQGR